MFGSITSIIKSHIESGVKDINLIVIMGDDRKDFIDSITKYFVVDIGNNWPNIYSIDGILLPREDMSKYKEFSSDPTKLDKLNMDELPTNAMSASFVRNIVKLGKKEKFNELYRQYLDQEKINTLYDSIKEGLEKPPAKSKPASKKQSTGYTYPNINYSKLSAIHSTEPTAKRARVNAVGGFKNKHNYKTHRYKTHRYKTNRKIKSKKNKKIKRNRKNKRTYKKNKRYTRK